MKWIVNTFAFALVLSASAAIAQTTKPDAYAVPSAHNSGAGIAGQPGSKDGPPVRSGQTVGSGSNASQQDTSNIKGLPGNKSGPAVKQPDHK